MFMSIIGEEEKEIGGKDEDLFDTLSYVFDDINDDWDIELRNILNNKFGANINEFRTLF